MKVLQMIVRFALSFHGTFVFHSVTRNQPTCSVGVFFVEAGNCHPRGVTFVLEIPRYVARRNSLVSGRQQSGYSEKVEQRSPENSIMAE